MYNSSNRKACFLQNSTFLSLLEANPWGFLVLFYFESQDFIPQIYQHQDLQLTFHGNFWHDIAKTVPFLLFSFSEPMYNSAMGFKFSWVHHIVWCFISHSSVFNKSPTVLVRICLQITERTGSTEALPMLPLYCNTIQTPCISSVFPVQNLHLLYEVCYWKNDVIQEP